MVTTTGIKYLHIGMFTYLQVAFSYISALWKGL